MAGRSKSTKTLAAIGALGLFLMVVGFYLAVSSLTTFNLWVGQSGTLTFLIGANMLVWSTDHWLVEQSD